MTTATLSEEDLAQRDALVGRLLAATIGALELLNVYVGDCLGLYRAIADRGRLTPAGAAGSVGGYAVQLDELLSRALDAHGGLGNCAGLPGLTAEMSLAFAEVGGPDDLSRRLQVAFPEYRGSLLLSLQNYFVYASKP